MSILKFFFKKKKHNFLKTQDNNKTTIQKDRAVGFIQSNTPSLNNFVRFLSTSGGLIKRRVDLISIIKNLNFFLYNNTRYIYEIYPDMKGVVEDLIQKKLSYIYIFNLVMNLVKPPFIVKSVLIPKKLRKRTKQKYLVKIVYKNDSKRLKNSYKQLYYYSNKFPDSKFKVRLYKSLLFSFLD